ncbi:MAG: hypothetical protein HOQ22_10915 [Nocardioidaceae bacterium]|nr:hypothetical protein [Nocardioidaceae bacterium]NUS51536.1 hypothetical protein [Nocardioidaceae bacterium]
MTYHLESLHLGTDFDQPPAVLPVPGATRNGDALALLDGAGRGGRFVARAAVGPALVGLRVDAPRDVPLRVALTLGVDDAAIGAWARARALEGDDHLREERRPRVVVVGVNGVPRAGVVLQRLAGDGSSSKQRAVLVLEPGDLPNGDLLTVSLEQPGGLPGWAAEDLLEDGLAGVSLDRVKVDVHEEPLRPSLSTGRAQQPQQTPFPASGMAVVNPASLGGDLRLRVWPRLRQEQARPRSLPFRAVSRLRRGTPSAPAAPEPAVEVDVHSLVDGSTTTLPADRHGDGTFTVRLAAASVPALVRPRLLTEPDGVLTGWSARVRRLT